MTDRTAALAEALRTILSDFDREPDDEYMAVAVPMFLSLLPPDWCWHDWYANAEALVARNEALKIALSQADKVDQAQRAEIASLREAYKTPPFGYVKYESVEELYDQITHAIEVGDQLQEVVNGDIVTIATLRAALDDVAVWLESEADHPRPDPVPAMRLQANVIRDCLAHMLPEADHD